MHSRGNLDATLAQIEAKPKQVTHLVGSQQLFSGWLLLMLCCGPFLPVKQKIHPVIRTPSFPLFQMCFIVIKACIPVNEKPIFDQHVQLKLISKHFVFLFQL